MLWIIIYNNNYTHIMNAQLHFYYLKYSHNKKQVLLEY